MILLLTAIGHAAPRGAESAPAPRGLEQAYARRVAVVVGIDHYPDDDSIPDLRYAAKDARDMAGVLRDPRWGDFDQTIELIGGYISQEAFWSALEAATATLNQEDTFVLYFAGHGTLELTASGTRLYLLPSDGQLSAPARTSIALQEVEDYVAALPARQRVVMVDACHSISTDARATLSAETRRQLAGLRGVVPSPPPRDVSASEVFLYAAAHSQPAQEDEELQNGVYTHFLLRALRGEADANRDGLVEVMELHDWVSARTEAHTGGLQVPQVQSRTVGREAIFLSGDASMRERAEETYRRRLAAMAETSSGDVRGATLTAPRRLRPEVQAGYRYLIVPAQDAAQAQALGAPIPAHDLHIGTSLRLSPGSGELLPLVVGTIGLAGLSQDALAPEVAGLLGVSHRRLDLGVGLRWSPLDGYGRPWHGLASAGLSPTLGRLELPVTLSVAADADGFVQPGISAGLRAARQAAQSSASVTSPITTSR